MQQGRLKPGETLAVFGCGGLGLSAATQMIGFFLRLPRSGRLLRVSAPDPLHVPFPRSRGLRVSSGASRHHLRVANRSQPTQSAPKKTLTIRPTEPDTPYNTQAWRHKAYTTRETLYISRKIPYIVRVYGTGWALKTRGDGRLGRGRKRASLGCGSKRGGMQESCLSAVGVNAGASANTRHEC